MKQFKRILVAVDFSGISDHAVLRAAELARFYQAQLILLNVVEHFPEHLPHFHISGEEMDPEEFILDRAGRDLDDLCARVGVENAETEVRLSKRSAKAEVISFIEENSIDLIVIGSRGHHTLTGMLAGSTATGVVRSAHCDVFIARGE